eukprot:391882-Rhodomonas_salina.1
MPAVVEQRQHTATPTERASTLRTPAGTQTHKLSPGDWGLGFWESAAVDTERTRGSIEDLGARNAPESRRRGLRRGTGGYASQIAWAVDD